MTHDERNAEIERIYPELLKQAKKELKDKDLALDIVHDAIERLLKSSYDATKGATFHTFARMVLHNLIVSHYEKQTVVNKHVVSLNSDQGETIDEQADDYDLQKKTAIKHDVRTAMAKLPNLHKQFAELYYIQRYTLNEIALMPEFSKDTESASLMNVRRIEQKTRRSLQNLLAEYEEDI